MTDNGIILLFSISSSDLSGKCNRMQSDPHECDPVHEDIKNREVIAFHQNISLYYLTSAMTITTVHLRSQIFFRCCEAILSLLCIQDAQG
jgi:hypothetical protein